MSRAAFNIDSKPLTRRTAVMTIAAAAVPSAAIANIPSNPDAELIALGRWFDALAEEHAALSVRLAPLAVIYDERMAKAHADSMDRAEMVALLSRIRDDLGMPPLMARSEEILDVTNDPMVAIMEMPARTIEGLAVKARVAAFACSHMWNENDDDADWDHLMARQLMRAVCDLAGCRLPSEVLVQS